MSASARLDKTEPESERQDTTEIERGTPLLKRKDITEREREHARAASEGGGSGPVSLSLSLFWRMLFCLLTGIPL